MTDQEPLTQSLEDYLEAIFFIINEQQAVRPKNIAERLAVSQPSVTGALKALAEKELIHYAPYGVITLTQEGKALAQKVARRHEVLHDFLSNVLGVEEEEAADVACKMEHVISENVLEKLLNFTEQYEMNKKGCAGWPEEAPEQACPHKEETPHCRRAVQDKGPHEKLLNMLPGQRGRIVHIGAGLMRARDLAEMNVGPSTMIEVEAGENERVAIKARGYHVSFHPEDAARIEVELV